RACAGGKVDGDGLETRFHSAALVEREHAGLPERNRPGLRQLDVEGPESVVDIDRAVQRVECRSAARAEAPAPEAMGTFARRRQGISPDFSGPVHARRDHTAE